MPDSTTKRRGKHIPLSEWIKGALAKCYGVDPPPESNHRKIDTPHELFASLERRVSRPTIQASVGQPVYSLDEDTGRVMRHTIDRVEGDRCYYSARLGSEVHSLPAYVGDYFTSIDSLAKSKASWIKSEVETCESIAHNLKCILTLPAMPDPNAP